jgi:hypothetical protein
MDVVFSDRPSLPLLVRMMNGMERTGRALVRLDVDNLLGAAQKRTGLSDFGNGAFRQGLERYTESLERDARLTTLGRLTARAGILQFLENRLAVIDYLKHAVVRLSLSSRFNKLQPGQAQP